MIRIIIIDDEQHAIDLICEYFQDFENVEIIAKCSNGFDAVKSINQLKPDLIFLDIQMPKLNGFEVLELLDYSPNVIFSTAYEEFAIKTFEKNAVDYLLKPFSKERFSQAIQKHINQANQINISVKNIERNVDRIVVKEASKIFIIPVEDVVFIESAGDYVIVYTYERSYVKNYTLKQYELCLPDNFVRVHRSSIINIDFVKEIQAYNKECHIIIMKNGKRIKTSRSGSSNLKQILDF
jgi:two-component system, LytTR family, response regulator